MIFPTLYVLLAIFAGGALVLFLLRLFSSPVATGVQEGTLGACPDRPNCVCSADNRPKYYIEPIHCEDSPTETWDRLKQLLLDRPRVRIVTEDDTYLHTEWTSRIFRFVDDVEFLFDVDQGVIHCRSASRAGHSDLGVNRKRIESIRAELGKSSRKE